MGIGGFGWVLEDLVRYWLGICGYICSFWWVKVDIGGYKCVLVGICSYWRV